MTVILRFAALRPRPDEQPLSLDSSSDFQSELATAIDAGDRDRVQELARSLRQSDFVSDPGAVGHGGALLELLARLRESGVPEPDELSSLVRRAAEAEVPDAFAADAARARDSVVAGFLLDDDSSAAAAADLVRIYAVASAALSGSFGRAEIQTMVDGALALPAFVRMRAVHEDASVAPEAGLDALVQQVGELSARHDRLAAALADLSTHSEDELELSESGRRATLGDLSRSVIGRVDDRPGGHDERPAMGEAAWEPAASPLLRAVLGRNLLLSRGALEAMPDSVVETIRGLDVDPAATSVAELHAQLRQSQAETGMQLMELNTQIAGILGPVHRSAVHVDPRWRLDPVDAPELPPPLATAAPGATPTPVEPLGVADLLLVRSHISRYERSEVAWIENVPAHDRLTHEVRRRDLSETTSTDETEQTDLRSLTQSTAEQNSGHTTVQAVGPGVGPVAAEGPASFAQSVTDQVSSTSTARTRRQLVERRLREVEDTTTHTIDNATGQTAYAVYQWLDKVYEARTFSYGSRLLYDLIVPEPAAVFREAVSRPRGGLRPPVRPAPFTVKPDALTSFNWSYYAAGHHASGVDAPPPEEIVVSEPFGKQAKDPFANDAASNTLTWAEARSTRIPKGYKATKYAVVVMSSSYDAGTVSVSVGTKSVFLRPANGVFFRTGRLDGERESIPVAVDVTSNGVDWGVSDVTVAVEIVCTATDELVAGWQVKTHGLILDANRARFDEYAEAVATREATARLVLQAMTPARKAGIVATEVKRTALAYLTGQSFSGFTTMAVDAAGFPYPQPAAVGAVAPYIRFLEQAVEWDHMAYAFLPYFWGAQTSWVSKLVSAEPDRGFADFLGSGAARVVLPVRPGYEKAFERFLLKGTVPTTAEMLDVGGPLWASLSDLLRMQAAPEGEETPVGEPWEFRLASDLLRARQDGSMPRWTFADGVWADDSDPGF